MRTPYRVVDLSDERGQFAGLLLAQLAADVVVVEPPGGSGSRRLHPIDLSRGEGDPEASLVWHAWNRGKRSVVIDLDDPSERERLLLPLIDRADVVVDSFDPVSSALLGLSPTQLAERNPRLVHASITPFGLDGPKASWPATDLTVWASAGPLALTGDADRAPVRVPGGQAFLHAAAESVGAIYAALLERERSGLGQHIDVSAQQAAAIAAQMQHVSHPVGDIATTRSGGGSVRGAVRNRYLYPAADGYVSITFGFGGQVAMFTARLLAWMAEQGESLEHQHTDVLADLQRSFAAGDPSAPSRYEELQERVAAFTARRTKAALFEAAIGRRLLIGPVSTMSEVLDNRQLASRGFFDDVDGTPFPGPYAISSEPAIVHRLERAPRLGEHTVEVLAELSDPIVRRRSRHHGAAVQSQGLLDGLAVLDFTWSMAGPIITRTLADYGATVVKIESGTRPDNARFLRPMRGGGGPSAAMASFGAGKLALGLNLSHPDARTVVLDLVRRVDVVVESFSPRAMAAWGLGYEALKSINPSLVMMSSCLMGQGGPYAGYAAFGNTAASIAGFGAVTGWPDRPPCGPYSAYTDYVSPRLATAALLAAIDHQRRTGIGCYLDVSQVEAAIHFLTPALLDAAINKHEPGCAGNDDPDLFPHGVYRCSGDDRWVAIACRDDRDWMALAPLIGRLDLAPLTLTQRRGEAEVIASSVESWTSQQSDEAAMHACISAGIPAHVVQNSEQCWNDPQLRHRQHFLAVPTDPDGTILIEAPRVRFSRSQVRAVRAGSSVGADSWWVLQHLVGYDEERITALMLGGVVE